jgi:Ribonuclease R winged-helix domain
LLILVRTPTGRLPNRRPGHTGGVGPHYRTTDLDLEILDLLREGPRSAYRLARKLAHEGEKVDTEAVRSRLVTLASRGLVVGTPSDGAGEAEAPQADPWKITGEGCALVEPEEGVATAPYNRGVSGEDAGRDAGFWLLITIAVVTAVCAAYSLLIATGVL